MLVGCIALQAITGWALMAYYSPSATTAWASVEHLNYAVVGGWLLRGLHHFGAQAMIVVVGLHVAQVAIYGAYKAPREVNWWLGLGLLGLTVGFGLTGYLLPWDQKGYWATRVATNIAGTTPIAGKIVQQLLVGGPEYGSMTLTRFFTLHVAILPALLVGLLGGHLALFRRHGVTPSASADTTKVGRFYPAQLAKDVAGVLLLFVV
ncbi:MAG TPA: cytochrome b N-terminal domain-containing protein, partial [Polyangiaceae bacterium]|nr:cytochrome b N-terminal domain-containing protein [Polyangiaceae bacterium]